MTAARVHRDRVVVIGGGIAGLATALSLAPLPVAVVTRATLETEGATGWAQGGIAAALGVDDSPLLHAQDTVAAGAGLSDPSIALAVAEQAAACVQALQDWGVRFDADPTGELALGLESVHRRRRIVHAGGDQTGATILTALARAARRTPSIEVLERFAAVRLVRDGDGLAGVVGVQHGAIRALSARAVVLATGGVGGLYRSTTNPLGAVGSGLWLAAQVGATLRDLEFVQFHPTAIALPQDPLPLASEAIRGEGAVLIDDRGERFMESVNGAELAARDIVARAIDTQLRAGRRVFLDARDALGPRFAQRFPDIAQRCLAAGIDPARMPIPVRPAAHYHMGGVRVDRRGRADVPGLWACGEVACTDLHGANRLASNSLLEAVVYARWVAQDLQGLEASHSASPIDASLAPGWLAPLPDKRLRDELRTRIEAGAGVVRDGNALALLLRDLRATIDAPGQDPRLADFASTALLLAAAAWVRTESRGAHYRADFPRPDESWLRHGDLTWSEAYALAQAA